MAPRSARGNNRLYLRLVIWRTSQFLPQATQTWFASRPSLLRRRSKLGLDANQVCVAWGRNWLVLHITNLRYRRLLPRADLGAIGHPVPRLAANRRAHCGIWD